MTEFHQGIIVFIELLLVVSLVAMGIRRLQIPYTVALVLVGLLIASQQMTLISITPDLILTLFVPPLVFEAAFHLHLPSFLRNLSRILLLAVPGVVLTTAIVAAILGLGASLSLPLALVFGALISATDPVAVIALFRTLGAPKRLALIVEGESLMNDGTAIVLFTVMLGALVTGQFNLFAGMGDFLRVSLGGTITGLILGWAVSRIIARVDDYLIETTLTTVLAFGAYLLADELHFSGVLAVLAAGLVNGNLGSRSMSPTTRSVLFNFWEYLAFLANSLVFLLIGLQVNLTDLLANWQAIVWAIGAVLIARVITVYGLSLVANRLAEPIPLSWQHILTWGGLRGAVALALALSLPAALGPSADLLKAMTFGVVLFTLLVQATTMSPLLSRLGLRERPHDPARIGYERQRAELVALQAAESHLEILCHDGLISTHVYDHLKAEGQHQIGKLNEALQAALHARPSFETEEVAFAQRELLRVERSVLAGLKRNGTLSEAAIDPLIARIDAGLYPLEEEAGEQAIGIWPGTRDEGTLDESLDG